MSTDVKRALERELGILRTVFGEADPRTQLVAGAISCGDAGVMAAVLAMRDRAVDNAKGLAAVKERLLDDAKAAPLQRYVMLDTAIDAEATTVRAMDRVLVGSCSTYSLERIPFARLYINPRCSERGLLGSALASMQKRLNEALSSYDLDGREEMVRALG